MGTCVPEAGIKGMDKKLHPTDIVGCNYLSMPLIPASRTQVLIWSTFPSLLGTPPPLSPSRSHCPKLHTKENTLTHWWLNKLVSILKPLFQPLFHNLLHMLTSTTAWMPGKLRDEITYPFRNFTGVAIGVWEWILNFIPNFIMDAIIRPCMG